MAISRLYCTYFLNRKVANISKTAFYQESPVAVHPVNGLRSGHKVNHKSDNSEECFRAMLLWAVRGSPVPNLSSSARQDIMFCSTRPGSETASAEMWRRHPHPHCSINQIPSRHACLPDTSPDFDENHPRKPRKPIISIFITPCGEYPNLATARLFSAFL
jgi:hypothetical protein